jgi:hypothetical protein
MSRLGGDDFWFCKFEVAGELSPDQITEGKTRRAAAVVLFELPVLTTND